jgi:hypothetical protein
MRPVVYTFIATDASYVCASQTLAGAGALIINGTGRNPQKYNGEVIIPGGFERQVTLTSTGNLSAANITITGLSMRGDAQTEVIAGPNNNTVTTTAYWKEIYSVTSSGALATAITLGIGTVGQSNPFLSDYYILGDTVTTQVNVTGTINYSAQITLDNPQTNSAPLWFSHPTAALVAATTDQIGLLSTPVVGQRILVNSSSGGSLVATIMQQALASS